MPTFDLGEYKVDVAQDFGPRVAGLKRGVAAADILVTLGDDSIIEHPGGVFRFRGGHRLWAAPEIAPSTYASDDAPCLVVFDDDRVTLTGTRDPAGMVKTVTLVADGDGLLVEHTIEADHDSLFAAWGITQLPLGGTALVPLEGPDTSPLPNRSLILWPYTDLDDPRLGFRNVGIEIEAAEGDPVKVGAAHWRSRLGYLRDGHLFTKEIVRSSVGVVPDFGASYQVYVGQGFCELETIGGQVTDGSAHLTERWQVTPCRDVSQAWELVTVEAQS